MKIIKNLKYVITITLLLVIISLGNNIVLATQEHESTTIDIQNGYQSDFLVLAWNDEITFDFEITTVNTELTFKITDLNASLFHYVFEPIANASSLTLNDGADTPDTTQTITDDNLPIGYHIDLDVLRHVKFTKVGNYTLEIANTHEHPADSVKFKFEFTVGLTGVESFGTTNAADSAQNDAPGFEFGISLLVILGVVITKKRFYSKILK